jgi:hypothetical protein
VGAAAGAALFSLIGAVLLFTARHDLAAQRFVNPQLAKELGLTDSYVITYTVIAANSIFWALVLGLLALLAWIGGRAARIIAAVVLAFTVLVRLGELYLPLTPPVVVLNVVVALLAAAAIVLFFLPATKAFRARPR